eukprot:TRINITY_DN14001_c0_g1_i1.p1 TRINITY_DN14001_c0_g1~~TRINITY_DN14001_c0_g1_i1.p1  ORF type:complete len:261 (+),score=54.98 TRINITY_DN14001_c0_g1_i1:388-1170(+)
MQTSHINMKRLLTDSTRFLPPFEVRSAQNAIDDSEKQITAAKASLLPKKKFSFSKKPATAPAPAPPSSSAPSSTPAPAPSTVLSSSAPVNTNTQTFSHTSDAVLIFPSVSHPAESTDFVLSHLTSCRVYLLAPLTALRVDHLKDCTLVTGPVQGSVFLDDCKDCFIHVASRQIRIHNSRNTQFYIYAKSHPIIEDCTDVHFAPYNVSYNDKVTHFQEAQFDESASRWENVEDFNWLRANEHSPNWDIIPHEKRKECEIPK